MIREKIPALSSWTLDELVAKMTCDKCGKRPSDIIPRGRATLPASLEVFKDIADAAAADRVKPKRLN